MAATRAQLNRKVRQEALREQLANYGLVQQVLDAVQKLDNLDEELDGVQVNRIKAGIDSRLKLIDKYLPALKAMELSGEGGEPVELNAKWLVEFVNAAPKDQS